MFFEIDLIVRSQRLDAELWNFEREVIANCEDESELHSLLWESIPEPDLRIISDLAGTPFSMTLEHFADMYEQISEDPIVYTTGGGGFILEDFDLEAWKRNTAGLKNQNEGSDSIEENEIFYRACSSWAALVVQADSEREATELVLSEAHKIFSFWTEVDDYNQSPFFQVDQILIESMKQLR